MRRLREKFFVSGWRSLVGLGALALVALGAASSLAQPANDYFTNATSLDFIGTPGTNYDSNVGASRETGEPLIATNIGGASVWYTWTAPSNGVVTFDTIGSDFDTLLGVYVGNNVTNLNLVADDNDSGGGGASQVTFNAPAGMKFYIAVDGAAGATGNIELNWSMAAPSGTPPNDNLANAIVLNGNSGTVLGYNIGATPEAVDPTNIVGGASIWYQWTAQNSGVLTIKTAGSSFDTLLAVLSGTNAPFQLVAANDDIQAIGSSLVSIVVTAGTTYNIDIDGYKAVMGFSALTWDFEPFPDNDNFANAASLPSAVWGTVSGNNVGASFEPNEPTHAGFAANHSVWYKWLAPQDGEVQMDTIGSTFDTLLAVYTGSSISSLSQIAANDDMIPTYGSPGIGQIYQVNLLAEPIGNTNIPSPTNYLTISPTNTTPPPPLNTDLVSSNIYQPYSGLPYSSYNGSGASGLRFNAKAGITYYFAIDGKAAKSVGPFSLNWAYHSSGVFRFASESFDVTTGVPAKADLKGAPGMMLYQVAETESTDRGGKEPNRPTTVRTSYPFEVNGLLVTITRVAGSSGRMQVGYTTMDGTNISDHYRVDPNSGTVVPDGVSIPLQGDAPAVGGFDAGSDYTPVSGVLTFDDFEMSKTILIPIRDHSGPQPNRDFAVVLFAAQRDPGESPLVSSPRLDPIFSQALVRILDADIDPRGPAYGPDPNGPYTNTVYVTNLDSTIVTNSQPFTNYLVDLNSTNAIFNFQKSNYRIPEDASDYWGTTPITVYVNRSGTNSDSASISYLVNSTFRNGSEYFLDNNEFPLQAGSDYATLNTNVIHQIQGRAPLDVSIVENGTLSWDAKDRDPKPITFTINNDNLPEFNEDFRIDLYEVVTINGNKQYRPVGMVGETTVTIMFDDNDPPAGSVDEFYNPDFGLNMVVPVNGDPISTEPREHPGTDAQGQVNALAVQPDDKTVIGGVFSTYNGTSRNGITRIKSDGEIDPSFDPGDGINIVGGDFVTSLVIQPDGKILVGGSFSSFNGQSCGNIIRLNTNGTLDATFRAAAGTGANGAVRSVLLQDDGSIVIGGDFTSYNGTTRQRIARLNADGSLDTTFDPGTVLNNSVYSLAFSPIPSINLNATGTGGGTTNQFFVGSASGVIRLNFDTMGQQNEILVGYAGNILYDSGSFNGTTNVIIPFGPGFSRFVTIAVIQNNDWTYTAHITGEGNGSVIAGGDFTSVGGVSGRDHITRFTTTGALDNTFDPNSGANGRVRALAQQADGTILVGGDFTLVNGQTANHFTRLGTDGSVDSNFFSGIGTDGTVDHINYVSPTVTTILTVNGANVSTQAGPTIPDSIYLGGPFTLYNGTHRLGFARLNMDGSVDTSFLDTAYNQFAGLPRIYFGDRLNAVLASGLQSDGKVMIGGVFSQVGGGQYEPNDRPESFDFNQYTEPKQRIGARNRSNVARLIGGATAGPGNIGLLSSSYNATKSQGFIYPLLTRTNGSLGYASANFSVVQSTAQPGLDYTYNAAPPMYPIMWEYFGESWMHSDGMWGTNSVMNDVFGHVRSLGINGMASVIVTINNNQLSSGATHAQFQMANPPTADQFFLGGENIPLAVGLGRTVSPLNIADDGKKPGTFGFTSPTYASSANATISVTRSNGNFNTTPITVDYATSAGPNTSSGVDYFDTSGTLTFNNGDTLKTFNVQIIQSNYISSVEKTVNLRLFNFPPGSALGLTNAILRIINPNFQGFLNLSSNVYSTNLTATAVQVTVSRNVGNKGTLDVQFSTANGTAIAGTDFVNTSTNLHWNNGDSADKIVTIPLINHGTIGGSLTFQVNIANASLNGASAPTVLGTVTNATVTINNDNNYGYFQFSSPTYVVNEITNGFATVTVLRTGSALGSGTVAFTTLDGTAFAGTNYIATNGNLSFAAGQTAASFTVRVLNDGITNNLPFYFNVALTNGSAGILLGSLTNAQVNILDAQSFNRPPGNQDVTFDQQGINADVLALALQPDGRIIAGGNFTGVNGIPRNHVARFLGNGGLDADFLNGLSGANGPVYTLMLQSDGNILLGGAFGTVDGVVRNHIARLAADGSLDTAFSPGAGADNTVFALAETFVGDFRKVYAGGAFTLFNGVTQPGIIRLNDNGTVDSSFASTGVNGSVYAIAVYPTNSVYAGKVLIAGSFNTVNGIAQTNIARLNVDGSLDTNFVVNADGIVRALAIQSDSAIVLGGEFSSINGSPSVRIARISSSGVVDTAFSTAAAPGIGLTVNTIALQSDNRVVVGGQFQTANGLIRHHITRLLTSGAPDTTINFGDGANGDIDAIAIQPVDQMIVIGGGFTQYNDQSAPYLTRLYGGSITGSGAFEFISADYQVNEDGAQAAIVVRRAGGSSGPNPDGTGNVTVQFATQPGTAVPGVNYTTVNTTATFAPGEVVQTVLVPIIDDFQITSNKTINLVLSNPSAPAILGDQTNAVLTIINTDSAITFSSPTYQVAKNIPTGVANINIIRNGGVNNIATVGFATTTNGTAIVNTDYLPTNAVVTFNVGETTKNVQIPVVNNNLPEGDRTVTMVISNILNSSIGSPSNAVLTIKDTVFSPGQLAFAGTNFFVNEGDGTATVTVIRTGGSSGTVSAFYYTTANTAVPGLNYVSVSNSLSFADGQTNRTFTVPIIDNNLAQPTVSFNVSLLTNLTSGTTLTYPSNAQVIIIDNDAGFAFVNATNTVRENVPFVSLGIIRIGPTNTSLSVDYATHDGTAHAGTNYSAASGTLNFTPGQTLKTLQIPIMDDQGVTGDLLFTVVLSTNSGSLGAQLAYPSTNTVIIQDADAGLSFTNSSMVVRRDAGFALVTVVCSNPSVEPVNVDSNTPPLSVQYATADGTALAGVDYLSASGTLLFTNGNGTNTFIVPVINNASVVGDRAFNIRLFNPTGPGRLVAPSNQTVTIIDAMAGIRFSKSSYSVNKTDGSATINVYRIGLTNEAAAVNFSATNGTAIDGVHFFSTNGTLIFTNGVTNLTFSVQVIDTPNVQPNKTVLLQLLNPSNSVLTAPNAGTLTIKDNTGSFVVPSGSALVSESGAGAPNGVIDSNETVTVLFGFRDAGGLNVGNLSATLLAANGVTPSLNPATQVYGPLISGSHSVSQPFTFTAQGTNGQEVVATFQLKDTGTNIGTAVFGYVLGTTTTRFTNSAAILINDNAIASPYPATISVSNVVGSILNTTVTLTNIIHPSPHDIDALLVSPNQQMTLFMAHAGGQNAISNVTVTFDDGASTTLPPSGQIISGTNKPSAYLPVPVFP